MHSRNAGKEEECPRCDLGAAAGNGVCAKPSAKERLEWQRVRAARSILAEVAPEVQSAADLKWH